VRDLLLPQALAARFPQSAGVSFYANHPGLVDTGDGAAAALNAHDFFGRWLWTAAGLLAKGAPGMTSMAM
jgi:hypothetical protein